MEGSVAGLTRFNSSPVTCTHPNALPGGRIPLRGDRWIISIGVGDECGWMTGEAMNGGVFKWKGV